jgi:glutamyl-tRNA reductase
MKLLLFGISHHTAPVDLRERFAIPEDRLAAAVRVLLQAPGIREGMILSTCNRFEVLAVADGAGAYAPASDSEGSSDARALLRALHPEASSAEPAIYEHHDKAAVRHLFRVASSLDSMVVGEPQILGQVKLAYRIAREAGAIGRHLDPLVTRSFAVAKRVRTDTLIASSPVSISRAAVDLARQIFGNLNDKTVLLIGAGKMGETTARILLAAGARRLLVANRTVERARDIAAQFARASGGKTLGSDASIETGSEIYAEALPLSEVTERGYAADVVISCTGSAQPILCRADVARMLARRRRRPMLLLDIAVPRDIARDVEKLEQAFVYNIDDLQSVVASNLSDRRAEAEKAELIIGAEVEKFLRRSQALELAPLIRSLQQHAETLRLQELARLRSRLGSLTPEQETALDALTRGLMNKWLHQPLIELKNSAAGPLGIPTLEAAQRLFGLELASNDEIPAAIATELARELDGAALPADLAPSRDDNPQDVSAAGVTADWRAPAGSPGAKGIAISGTKP